MINLTPSRRRALRAKAHALRPCVAVGQHGLTPSVLHEIDVALLAHELIKIRVFSDLRDDRAAMLARICEELGAAPVQHIGKLLVVWRQAPEPAPAPVKPERARVKAPRTPPKSAGQKPRGNARTLVTAGAKVKPRTPSATPATRRARGAPAVTGASAFADEPGTRRRSPIADRDNRRAAPRPAKPGAARRGAAGTDRKPAAKRPPSPHGKSASSIGGASGARRRRKAR